MTDASTAKTDEKPIEKSGFVGFLDRDHGASNGDRAALRRWRPGQPISAPAFWRVGLRYNIEVDAAPEAWALIFSAITQTTGAHRFRPSLGAALAEAGVSEARLTGLLTAPAARRPDVLLKIVGQLASARQGFDVDEFIELVLQSGGPDADERRKRRLASDFYRADHKKNNTQKKDA